MTTRLFADESRTNWAGTEARPLLTMIWYPAEAKAEEREITIGAPDKPLFLSGRAARDAKVLPGKRRYPLIILSHGTGGAALQLMWLGEYLAAARFYCRRRQSSRQHRRGEQTYRARLAALVGTQPRFVGND